MTIADLEEEKKRLVEKEAESCLDLKNLQSQNEKLTTEIELQIKHCAEIEYNLNSSEEANQILRQQLDKSEEEKHNLNNDLLAKGFDERKLQAENNDLTEKLLSLSEKLAKIDDDLKVADETIDKLKQQKDCDQERIHSLLNNIQSREFEGEKFRMEIDNLRDQVNKLFKPGLIIIIKDKD